MTEIAQPPASPAPGGGGSRSFEVVGVVFSAGGQLHVLETGGLDLAWNERVVCATTRGRDYGRVVQPNREATRDERRQRLLRVIRRATPDDDARRTIQRGQADTAMRAFRRVIREGGLPLKPFASEVQFDGARIVVSYGSEERQDVRELAAKLSREVGTKVELRHVRAREGARLVGGIGLCGEVLCCTRVPTFESPITLRMAKEQDLPVNPGRVTGLCGRLRCCLTFEHPRYRAFRERAPAVGRVIDTPHGKGTVRSYKVPVDAIVVRLDDEKGDVVVKLDDLAAVAPQPPGPEGRQRRRRR